MYLHDATPPHQLTPREPFSPQVQSEPDSVVFRLNQRSRATF